MSSSGRSDFGGVFVDNALTGALVGAVAYVASYLLTYAFVAVDGVDTGGQAAWKMVGLVFYSAHNVESVFSASGAGTSLSQSINLISNSASEMTDLGGTVPSIVYYAAPAVILVLAGFVVVRTASDHSFTTGTAIVAGTTVAVGYLVLGVVGRFAFQSSQSLFGATAAIAPDLVTSVLLLGVIYPVVLGAIGGAVGAATR